MPHLLSYWNFDTAPDDVVPDQIADSPHEGTLQDGAAITEGGRGYGQSGEALDISETEEGYMSVAEPELYDFNADFTWTARVKLFEPVGGEGAGIFGRSPAVDPHNPGSKILFVIGQSLAFDVGWVGMIESVEELALDAWHQVTVTYQAEDDFVSLYLDEVPVRTPEGDIVLDFEFDANEFPEDEEAPFDPFGFANSGLRLGGGGNDFITQPFPGLIDDAAMWSTVLSADDIAWLVLGAPPLAELRPSIRIRSDETGIIVEFVGTLQFAEQIAGPWEEVSGASSPYEVPPDQPMRFFRSSD
jgi:hypothetical protein